MTRKKAIEAALHVYDDTGSAEQLAASMYEEGRIAGLREAARMAASYKNRRAMQPDQFAAAEVIEGMVSDHARALAKKARGK